MKKIIELKEGQVLVNYRHYPRYHGKVNTQFSYRCTRPMQGETFDAMKKRGMAVYVVPGKKYYYKRRDSRSVTVIE